MLLNLHEGTTHVSEPQFVCWSFAVAYFYQRDYYTCTVLNTIMQSLFECFHAELPPVS